MLKPGKADWRPATPHTPEWFALVTLRASGEWHLHGGSVENGETKREAAFRETEEETGVRVSRSVHGQIEPLP